MSNYSIKDLETLSGVKAHTLRIWEQRYNILTPNRTDTNIRLYTDEDVKRILNVSLLNQHGHKISKISKLSLEEMNLEVLALTQNSTKHPEQVHNLILCMLDYDEVRFNHLFNRCVEQFGFEETMMRVVYPFLTKVGTLWQTGAINPAQEHFISHLIIQKLITEINNTKISLQLNSKKCMLYLAEDEHHELSLLFTSYLFKSRGFHVLYLGQNLPFVDALSAYNTFNPDIVFTVFTSANPNLNLQEYINNMSDNFEKSEIYITGYRVVGNDYNMPQNTTLLTRIDQIFEILEK